MWWLLSEIDSCPFAAVRRGAFKGTILALCCVLLTLLCTVAHADISAQTTLSSDQVKLGEQFELSLSIVHDEGYSVDAPDVGKTLGDFVVVDTSPQRGKTEDGRLQLTVNYTLAGFRLERATVASIEIAYTDSGGRPGKLVTDALGITIVGTVPEGVSEIKDIKGMAPIRPRMALWLKIVIALVAAAIIFAVVFRLVKKARQRKAVEPEKRPLPASVVALAELEKLVKSGLLFEGRKKEFYFRLSEILRRFLAGRLGFPADDMTTTEIEYAMRDNPISSEFTIAVLEILRFSDMVKFAKLNPLDPEDDEIVRKTRHGIELGQEPLSINEASAKPAPESTSAQSRG